MGQAESEIRLSQLIPEDIRDGYDCSLSLPCWAFRPDQWSAAFLRGLRSVASTWSNKQLWEVGVGSGVNSILVSRWAPDAVIRLSDYDPRCVPVAFKNVARSGCTNKIVPLHGAWDLLTPSPDVKAQDRVDVIFGCLPQVPADEPVFETDGAISHYYTPGKYPDSVFNGCGLGLNETLLRNAREVLPLGGQVVLNLAGRPGLPCLLKMFEGHGYKPAVLHQEMIRQHESTDIESLARLEAKSEFEFEFYADQQGCLPLNARQAESRRANGKPLHHKIYVIAGTLA